MASTSKIILRDSSKIFLVGSVLNHIVGSKLPSIKQSLSELFYNMRVVKLNLHESSKLVIRELIYYFYLYL